MVDDQLLLSLLQFVALVAPAIAILMQYFQSSESASQGVFGILEGALTLMVVGGLVIGYQLIIQIDNLVLSAGISLIFGSLLFIAVAVWWRHIPISLDISVWDLKTTLFLIEGFISLLALVALPILAFWLFYYFTKDLLNAALNYGIIAEDSNLTPSLFIGGVALLLIVRTILYLGRTGAFTEKDFSDAISDSFSVTFALLIGVILFTAPVFILFYIPLNIQYNLGPLSQPTNIVFTLPYLWTILIILVIFSAKLSDEAKAD